MRTPISYYGGKQRLAGKIVGMIPKHALYCEPFFGGGAVFFRKAKAGIEVINDNDDRLITFYKCVKNHFHTLNHLVQQTLHSERLYRYAKDILNKRVEATDIELAWAVWLSTNSSFSGSLTGGWKNCNGTSGGHVGTYMKWRRAEFTERLHERLSEVQISCRDALKVIRARDGQDTFFYVDPPYPGSNQQHYRGYTHKDLYNLLQLLATIKGKFILSNYWSQTLKYHILRYGWHYEAVEVSMQLVKLGGEKVLDQQTRTEILVYNFDVEKDLFN
jgi:DNA adenine methylase